MLKCYLKRLSWLNTLLIVQRMFENTIGGVFVKVTQEQDLFFSVWTFLDLLIC